MSAFFLIATLCVCMAAAIVAHIVLEPVRRRRAEKERLEREAKLEALRAMRVRVGSLSS